jgi:PKD repeat protein
MRLRYLLPILILFALVPIVSAAVTEVEVSPDNPQEGDTISVHIFGDPNEEIEISITFEVDIPVQSGNYVVRFKNINIPDPSNSFSVETYDVKTLNVAASVFSLSGTVNNKVGEFSVNNILPGTFNIKISGYAEDDEDFVSCSLTAWSKLTLNSNGAYVLNYDMGNIPPGIFYVNIEGITKQLTISPRDSNPPVITGIQPTTVVATPQPIISATYSDSSEIDVSSVVITFDGAIVTSQSSVDSTGFTYYSANLLNNTNYQVQVIVDDIRGNTASRNWDFSVQLPPIPDTIPPTISNLQPTGIIQSTSTTILASIIDNKRIDTSSVLLELDDQNISDDAQITQNSISYALTNLLNNTLYNIVLSAQDMAGNFVNTQWSFTVLLPPENPPNPDVDPPVIDDPPRVNFLPEPHIDAPSHVLVGDPIQFNASNSFDPDGIITNYLWNLDDGITKTGPLTSYVFQTDGEKTIILTVTDNRGSSISTTTSITVYSLDNYTINVVPGSSRKVFAGQQVTFDGSNSFSLGGKITLFRWDYGDSTTDLNAISTHTYSQPGIYNATLTVTDQRWASSSASIEIEVIAPPIQPSYREDSLIINNTLEISSQRLGTNVTISSKGETGLLVLEYPTNPFPSKSLPSNSIGQVKDISLSNPDSIDWPILVEINIDPTLDNVLASRLGIYWFNGTTWSLCQNTGYNITTRAVWAFMTRLETSGSPIIPAVQPSQPDIVLTSIIAEPMIAGIGDVVVITMNLQNNGDLTGTYSSDLSIGDDNIHFSEEVNGHNSSTFFYAYSATEPGNFTVIMDVLETSLEVKPGPADLLPVSISVITDPIFVTESFAVNLVISNIGDSKAKQFDIQLLIDNTVVDQKSLESLPPNTDSIIEFTSLLNETGEHSVSCVVDSSNDVDEINEENNEISSSFLTVKKPFSIPRYSLISLLLIVIGYAVINRKKIKDEYSSLFPTQ